MASAINAPSGGDVSVTERPLADSFLSEDDLPATKSGEVGLIMAVVTGKTEDSQWFDYRLSFFGNILRVEWDIDSMDAILPLDTAEVLIRNGYARFMTRSEARAYNNRLKESNAPVPEPPVRKPKKGED
jgi:hypothetical protein